jgi:DNA invertase Pin-like site-specific DNA recombinase
MPSHIHAYAYLSRAAHGQAIDEVSLQVQLARIETFLKSYNIPNRKVFRQTRRIGHTEEGLTQTAFESAIAAAKRTSGFIVVSSLDRLERNSQPHIDFVSGGGTIVAVDEGFGVRESDVRDLAAKAAVVSKRIADQARLGRESALERGVTFGNPRVRGAGVEGTQANQVNARERYIEFLELTDRAKANGARLDKQIVAIFNTWGYPNARGGAWKISNYSRVKRKALAAKLNCHEPDSTVISIDQFELTDATISVELSTNCFEPTKCKTFLTPTENTVEADVSTIIDDVCWDELAELAATAHRKGRDSTEFTLEEIEQTCAELDKLLLTSD